MNIRARRGSNAPFLREKRGSANLGVYKLSGAILIGGVRWHQTFPGWWAAGWLSMDFRLPLVASSRKVVSSLVGFELVGSIPASCGLPPKSGVSFEHSVVWCLAGPRPISGMVLSIQLSGARLAHGELLALSSSPLVNCFVPNVSLLRCSSSAHGWDKHGYNGSFF